MEELSSECQKMAYGLYFKAHGVMILNPEKNTHICVCLYFD